MEGVPRCGDGLIACAKSESPTGVPLKYSPKRFFFLEKRTIKAPNTLTMSSQLLVNHQGGPNSLRSEPCIFARSKFNLGSGARLDCIRLQHLETSTIYVLQESADVIRTISNLRFWSSLSRAAYSHIGCSVEASICILTIILSNMHILPNFDAFRQPQP